MKTAEYDTLETRVTVLPLSLQLSRSSSYVPPNVPYVEDLRLMPMSEWAKLPSNERGNEKCFLQGIH